MAINTAKTAEEKAAEKAAEKARRAFDKEVVEINALDERKYNTTKLYVRDAEQILAAAQDEPEFLIKGAITKSSLFMIQGDPESLKSWLAYDLALAGAHQREWLDFDAPDPFSTLILNFDNPDWELGRRLKKLGLKPEDKNTIHAHLLGDARVPEGLPALLQLPEGLDALLFIADELKPDLIVVDSLRQSHFGEEESSSDAMRLMSAFKAISAAAHGATVILLHHLRKMQQGKKRARGESIQEARGSTEFIASLDGSITVTREGAKEENQAVAIWGKTRGWNPPEALERAFRVVDEGNETYVEQTKTNFSNLIEVLKGGPLTKMELCKELNMDVKQLSRLVGRAKAAELIQDAKRSGENSTRRIELKKK